MAVFAEDDVGAASVAHVGDGAQRDARPERSLDEQLAQAVRACAPCFWQAQDERHGALSFAQLGDFLPADERGEEVVERSGSEAVGGGAFAVRLDAELGNIRLRVETGFFKSGDGAGDGLHLLADAAQLREVGAEDFHRHGGGDSAEHVADAVGQRAADDGEGSGDAAQTGVDLRDDFGARAFAVRDEIHVELGG